MRTINIGDIWIVAYPKIIKNNKNNISIEIEKRPCLIIDDGHGFIIENNNDYLGLKVTSKEDSKTVKKILIKDWYDLGLKQKSYVRIEIPVKIEKEQLIHKIGHVNKYDLYVYLNELSNYFNVDMIEDFKSKVR